MKNDPIYPFYLAWLNSQLDGGKISKGQFSILKITFSKFEDFKIKFEADELFNSSIIKKYKSENRDQKINDIFDEFD